MSLNIRSKEDVREESLLSLGLETQLSESH